MGLWTNLTKASFRLLWFPLLEFLSTGNKSVCLYLVTAGIDGVT